MSETLRKEIRVPAVGLIVLVGVSGSGKTTFARDHFKPTEVISSDFCRGLVSDDETDQAATADAFDVLHHIVGVRLRRGLLTVVDATNVQRAARAELITLAKSHDVLTDAIVLDVPPSIAAERDAVRTDRQVGRRVIDRQHRDLTRSLKRIRKEGFRRVHVLAGAEQIAQAEIVREKPWNDRSEVTGPFDIIGDVHGCAAELRTLLTKLGWELEYDELGRAINASHSGGRQAVFVGDLVDRGPDTPGVLRLVMSMVEAGRAWCVSGNHEAKLVRALKGANVTVSHGLAESLEQLAAETDEFQSRARDFMDRLISHYVFDDGKLVVAHAGLKEAYHGRASARVRAFALYGDTTGETDEYGLPVRYPWAEEYRGAAMVVYGHTPVPTAEWVNNTMCLDTGVVFGGELTALRYPEREIVAVPAERQWYEPVRPLAPSEPTVQAERDGSVLRLDDVAGTRWLPTSLAGRVKVDSEQATAALEVMRRFATDPRWLVYLPPTMSPVASSQREDYLEHPDEAFAEYERWGVTRVVCEEKHMGSRAIAVVARDSETAAARFGITDGSSAMVYTRTGRAAFDGPGSFCDGLSDAVAPLLDELESEWVVLDCELLPWSAKALGLIRDQFVSVGTAALHGLTEVRGALEQASARGLDVGGLLQRTQLRLDHAKAFRNAWANHVRPGEQASDVGLAPFQVLAAEGRVLAITEPHEWHMATLGRLRGEAFTPTRHRFVDLDSSADREAATRWWEELTAAGSEGMVVKPAHLVGPKVQPGLKVRGREYLRLVYGPDYGDSIPLLKDRNLGKKRQLAHREHGLGIEALSAFVTGEPLWKVHRYVFAVLAMESERVDPRL